MQRQHINDFKSFCSSSHLVKCGPVASSGWSRTLIGRWRGFLWVGETLCLTVRCPGCRVVLPPNRIHGGEGINSCLIKLENKRFTLPVRWHELYKVAGGQAVVTTRPSVGHSVGHRVQNFIWMAHILVDLTDHNDWMLNYSGGAYLLAIMDIWLWTTAIIAKLKRLTIT